MKYITLTIFATILVSFFDNSHAQPTRTETLIIESEFRFDESDDIVSQQAFEIMEAQKVSWLEEMLRRIGTPIFLKYIMICAYVKQVWHSMHSWLVKKPRIQKV